MTDAAAELVERGDPDRFAATMAAPPAARRLLWPLYAANVEIARAPWASAEPMVAEMRLQWWADTIGALAAGSPRGGHPVTEALAPLLGDRPDLAPHLAAIVEARRHDCWPDPFADAGALATYIDATAGNLAWAAASALGAPPAAATATRDIAFAGGLATYLRAAPDLARRGRSPFPDESPEALGALARSGLDCLARGRAGAAGIPRGARPALWPAADAAVVLGQAVADPARIAAGRLGATEFRKRGGLLWRALTGAL